MVIRELEYDDLAHDFDKIREELLKWCIMPARMNRDGKRFDKILGNVANIAEWIAKSNHIYEIQEAGAFDWDGELSDYEGTHSISKYLPLWEWFAFMFGANILQMRADEIAIDFNEPKCNLCDYAQEIDDFVTSVSEWDYTEESLYDLKSKLDECAEKILEKSKI